MHEADGIRVLLADDDRVFVESLRVLMADRPGLEVVGAAGDGHETIGLAERLRPDAVVIDLHMPLLDGVAAVARLRRAHPSLCLIALTGDPDAALHEQATGAGADAVLLKGELLGGLMLRLAAAGRTR